MGTTPSDTWFDSEGNAVFWKNMPMKTVKKALFKKGNTVRSLMKLVANGITYDFRATAEGGAVIVPPDYSAIEFISPDGRINYKSLLSGNLGNALTSTIAVLQSNPIPSWDKFARWIGLNGTINMVADQVTGCEILTICGEYPVAVNVPEFSRVADMAAFLRAVYTATAAAHGTALSLSRVDDASFGWIIRIHAGDASVSVGFIFRE